MPPDNDADDKPKVAPYEDAAEEAYEARRKGLSPNGTVSLRDFDQGIVETLGAKLEIGPDKQPSYFLRVRGVSAAPELPGIPVVFAAPEDVFKTYVLPVIVVRRDDITPAMGRWHPGTMQFHAPGNGPLPVSVPTGKESLDPRDNFLNGFDRNEELQQATPFDILYTISILGRDRSASFSANALMTHVIRRFPPYGTGVILKDSIGDVRSYEVFNRGISNLDKVPEVTERVIGFAVSLDVEAELDLADPYTKRAVKICRPNCINNFR